MLRARHHGQRHKRCAVVWHSYVDARELSAALSILFHSLSIRVVDYLSEKLEVLPEIPLDIASRG